MVETNRKSQTDNLLKITKFFNINVSVTEHKTLNSCKGIIRDRMLKHETEENITEYLNTQGVTACKRFKIKKDGNFIETFYKYTFTNFQHHNFTEITKNLLPNYTG